MNKAIFIGELALHVSLRPDDPTRADVGVGDWAVNAAMLDGLMGLPVIWLGEASASAVGQRIVSTLEASKVDVSSIDRFSEGLSPLRIASSAAATAAPDHYRTPIEPASPVWPRVNEGDTVIFGSYMALEERNHAMLLDFLRHAKARKATIVYLPYFEPGQVPRITRVMPQVFDALEAADMVIARAADVAAIFEGKSPEAVFVDHIKFYCGRFLCIDPAARRLRFFDGNESWHRDCHPSDHTDFQWCAGALAGAVRSITAETPHDADDIMERADETAHSELAASITHPVQR